MKRFPGFLAAAAVLVLALHAHPASTFPNEPKGFRGLTWGQNLGSVPGMAETGWESTSEESIKAFREKLDYRLFTRSADELRIGSVPVAGIRYQAWRGRFRGAVVTLSPKRRDALVRILAARFGEGTAERREGRALLIWKGKASTMELEERYQTLELRIFSTEIDREERKTRRDLSVRSLRKQEALDRKAVAEGEGF